TRCGDMTFLYVGNGPPFFLDGPEEVQHLPTRGRSSVHLNTFFSLVFRILLPFVYYIFVDLLGIPVYRHKVILHGAAGERAFLTVEFIRPGILRIGRCAPRTVLPYASEFVEFE